MYFFGLLWVVSAIGSFFSPQNAPKLPAPLLQAIPTRSLSVINAAIHAQADSGNPANTAIAASNSLWTHLAATSSLRPTFPLIHLMLPFAKWSVIQTSLLRSELAIHSTVAVAVAKFQPQPGVLYASSTIHPTTQMVHTAEFSGHILKLVEKLSFWSGEIRELLRLPTPTITIIPVRNACLSDFSIQLEAWNHSTNEVEAERCLGLEHRDALLQLSPNRLFQVRVRGQVRVYQVRVKGQAVAEVPTLEQAEAIARRLYQILRDPSFNPYTLTPAIVNATPAGKMGDQVIFWIDSDLAEHLDRSPELAAIAWINSLRSVFEIPPFTLVEAQSQMYGLVATDRRLSGIASWYGPYFHGRQTAMGEIFDQNELTAAHPSLPFGTYLRVTNLRTGKMVIVRINDRGPYFENRSLDLSREAARCLDSEIAGVVPYEAVIMESVELTQFRAAIRLEDAVDEPMQPSIARNPSKQ